MTFSPKQSRLNTYAQRMALTSFLALATTVSFAQDRSLIVEADDSLQWLRAQNQYIATGNASAEQGDLKLTANVIIADYESSDTGDGDYDASFVTFVEGKENAKLTRASLTATAENISYDVMDEIVTLTGGNPVVINGDERLSADQSIIYNRSTRQIVALGNAMVKLSNGQILQGNEVNVVLNKDESDIDTVDANGNAVVISPSKNGDRRAEASNMSYTRETGLAILTGNVKLMDKNNIMTGDRAEIDTVTGTSTMSSTTKGQRVGGVFKPAQ